MMVMVMVTLVAQFIAITPHVGHAASYRTDVILLHGFQKDQAVNCNQNWSDVVDYFSAAGSWAGSGHSWSPVGSIVALNYYSGDTTCSLPEGIPTDTLYHYTEAGTYGAEGGCGTVGRPDNLNTVEGTNSEDIERLGCKLDWYIYNNYTKFGLPVVILAHSMGGLIARWGLGHDQEDSRYPGALWVPAVVTIGTPHQSASSAGIFECGNCWQANEMVDDTTDPTNLMELLKPIQSPSGDGHGTGWMTMAMANVPDSCSNITYTDGTKDTTCIIPHCQPANVDSPWPVWPDPIGQTMSGSYRIEYTNPCYSHGAYLYNRDYLNYTVDDLPHTLPNTDDSDASANYCAPSCNLGDTLTTATNSFPKPLKAAYGFLSAHVPALPPTPTPTVAPGACVQSPSDATCDNQDYKAQGCNAYGQSQTYNVSPLYVQLYYSTNCQSNWTYASVASGYQLYHVWVERQETIAYSFLSYGDYVASPTWYTNMVWAPVSPARSCASYKNLSTGAISGGYCTNWAPVSTTCKSSLSDAHCTGQDYVVQGCNAYAQSSPSPVSNSIVSVTDYYSTNCESNWAVAKMNTTSTDWGILSVKINRGAVSGGLGATSATASNSRGDTTWWSYMVFAPSNPSQACVTYAYFPVFKQYTICTNMA